MSALPPKADIHRARRDVRFVPKADIIPRSPVAVLCKNVIPVLHYRVAREPALGVVSLRRRFRLIAGPKRIGRRVILERGPPPSAAIREPLAVLLHEMGVQRGTRHHWLTGVRVLFFRVPMDFCQHGTVWERLAIAGHASPKGGDCGGIPCDHSEHPAVLTYRDDRPVFVSPELGAPGTSTVYLSIEFSSWLTP